MGASSGSDSFVHLFSSPLTTLDSLLMFISCSIRVYLLFIRGSVTNPISQQIGIIGVSIIAIASSGMATT